MVLEDVKWPELFLEPEEQLLNPKLTDNKQLIDLIKHGPIVWNVSLLDNPINKYQILTNGNKTLACKEQFLENQIEEKAPIIAMAHKTKT